MFRCLILGLMMTSAWASSELAPSDLKGCNWQQLESKAEALLKKKNIGELYVDDSFDSFALKVLAPHLLKKVVLMSDDFITCYTMREEGDAWEQCLSGRLQKKEMDYLKQLKQCQDKAQSRDSSQQNQ